MIEDFSGVIQRGLFSAYSTIGGNDSAKRSKSWEGSKVLSGSISAIVMLSAKDVTKFAGEGESTEKKIVKGWREDRSLWDSAPDCAGFGE